MIKNKTNSSNNILSRITGSTFINSSAGFSLVELIVVIAIMGVVVAMSSIGIGILNGKDARRCATALDDALKDARMTTMTKQGEYSLQITTESGNYVANLVNSSGGSANIEKSYNLEGSGKTIKSIIVDGNATPISDSYEVVICFDARKGNVLTDGSTTIGGVALSSDEVMKFTVSQIKGDSTKVANVSLVTATGKHMVGTFD